MKTIQKVLNVSQNDYYKTHLSIINALFPVQLTPKEIEVLAGFMSLDKTLTEGDMFNSQARKKVRHAVELSAGGLGNHLKSMIDKGFLDKSDITNKLSVKSFLIPEDDTQGYQFKIVKV